MNRAACSTFVMLACAICSGAPPACARRPDPALTLRFHNMSEPRTLDPAGATGVAEKNLLLALSEGLTTLDPKTALPAPGVAERYTVSPDGLTYRFFLRECQWSDGEPVTAQDFRESWIRVLNPANASPLATMMYLIRGARELHQQTGTGEGLAVRVVSNAELEVGLAAPDARFLQLCASSPFVPVPVRRVVQKGFFTNAGLFTGNGPFVLAERIPNFRIVMKKNPKYWDAANVQIETLVAYAGENKQTAVDAFRAGRTDWVDDFPTAQAAGWAGQPGLRTSPYLATYFLRFNTTKPPFNDRRVREAVHLAIDRDSICNNILQMGQRPALSLTPTCMTRITGYVPPRGPGLDVARARALLAGAGFPGGAGFPQIEYQYDTNDDHRRIGEAIQAMLRENLGISLFLINKEKKVLIDDEERLRYRGLSRGSWIADAMDPLSFLEIFHSRSPANRTGFSHQQYDAWLDAAQRSADPEERARILANAEKLLVESEFPFTPIFEYIKLTLVNPERIIGGFHENPMGYHPMKWIRLAR